MLGGSIFAVLIASAVVSGAADARYHDAWQLGTLGSSPQSIAFKVIYDRVGLTAVLRNASSYDESGNDFLDHLCKAAYTAPEVATRYNVYLTKPWKAFATEATNSVFLADVQFEGSTYNMEALQAGTYYVSRGRSDYLCMQGRYSIFKHWLGTTIKFFSPKAVASDPVQAHLSLLPSTSDP